MRFLRISTPRRIGEEEQERILIFIKLLLNLSYTVSHYSTVISNCTGNTTEQQNDTEFNLKGEDMHAHKDREKERVS